MKVDRLRTLLWKLDPACLRIKVQSLLDELHKDIIEKTNANDIKEISIPKETVFIAKNSKPFKKSAKQTLMRKEIEKDYKEEIENAYRKLAKGNGA